MFVQACELHDEQGDDDREDEIEGLLLPLPRRQSVRGKGRGIFKLG